MNISTFPLANAWLYKVLLKVCISVYKTWVVHTVVCWFHWSKPNLAHIIAAKQNTSRLESTNVFHIFIVKSAYRENSCCWVYFTLQLMYLFTQIQRWEQTQENQASLTVLILREKQPWKGNVFLTFSDYVFVSFPITLECHQIMRFNIWISSCFLFLPTKKLQSADFLTVQYKKLHFNKAKCHWNDSGNEKIQKHKRN